MIIAIPTYGRAHKQTTLQNLPESIRSRVVLVVQDRELERYNSFYNIEVLPQHITTIGPTRQWMIENLNDGSNKQVQLDDDLSFAVRREDNPSLFRAANTDDLELLFTTMEKFLDNYAQVGVGHREGGNRITNNFCYNTRITRMFGLRTDAMAAHNVRFDRLECKVDFDVSLQLLRAGFDNIVLNNWVHNQNGSNTEGGCSHFRTKEVLEKAAFDLERYHRPFVTVVKKQTKTAWGGGERTDVRIQWKKARESAGLTRVLDQREGSHTTAQASTRP